MPPFHVVGVALDLFVEALDAVGRLQAPSQLLEQAKPVEGERLFQPFHERIGRLPVDLLQLGMETGEPLFGGLVGRLLVDPLELPPPLFLVGLRKVADHVFPLVPLAALDLGAA